MRNNSPWPPMLPALDGAAVFPCWDPDKWLTENDNPQNNRVKAWRRSPWSVRDSFWIKAATGNRHQSGYKWNQLLYPRLCGQRNLQKTTNRVGFIGCEGLAALEQMTLLVHGTKIKLELVLFFSVDPLIKNDQWEKYSKINLLFNGVA